MANLPHRIRVSAYWCLVFVAIGMAATASYQEFRARRQVEIMQQAMTRVEQAIHEMRESYVTFEEVKARLEAEVVQQRRTANRVVAEVAELREDRTRLIATLHNMRSQLEDTEHVLAQTQRALVAVHRDREAISGRLESLMVSRVQLLDEKSRLEQQLASMDGLKQALRELKRTERRARKMADARALADGNQGYVVHNGMSTLQRRVKVEVLPADL